ncbi:hypothetical protein DFH28DRAFT_897199, partial [Melampsora americana]
DSGGESSEEEHPKPPRTIRALREGVTKKIEGPGVSHLVNVSMKNTEAAERANEITLMALERHKEQVAVTTAQRERELAQSQARLDLDAQTARETIQLRREELKAASEREDKQNETVSELKSSMANVQGTLSEMGSVLKMLAQNLKPAKDDS